MNQTRSADTDHANLDPSAKRAKGPSPSLRRSVGVSVPYQKSRCPRRQSVGVDGPAHDVLAGCGALRPGVQLLIPSTAVDYRDNERDLEVVISSLAVDGRSAHQDFLRKSSFESIRWWTCEGRRLDEREGALTCRDEVKGTTDCARI